MLVVYPFGHPFRDASLKIAWADEHLDSLEKAVRDYESRNPYKLVVYEGQVDGDRERFTFYPPSEHPPDTFGLSVGDAVINMRSALDSIAWVLHWRYEASLSIQHRIDTGSFTFGRFTSRQKRLVSFPIYRTNHAAFLKDRALPLLPPQSHSVIESFQPYHRETRPELWLLAMLDDLSNLNKHRIVNVTFGESSLDIPSTGGKLIIPTTFDDQGGTLEISAKLADELKLHLNPHIPIKVGFGVSTSDATAVVSPNQLFGVAYLREINNLIRDKVLPAFAGLPQ